MIESNNPRISNASDKSMKQSVIVPDSVVGFCFDLEKKKVILCVINNSTLDGIAGHVKQGELYTTAMSRIFKEKADLGVTSFQRFAITETGNSKIHFLKSFIKFYEIMGARSTVSEKIFLYDMTYPLNNYELHPNLKWLIPMALDDDLRDVKFKY